MTAGVTTVVAPMGTALTDWQSVALRKLMKNVFLLYDSDKAGFQATFRSGDELLRQGASVRVVTLPDGEDPDTFVKKNGATALTARLRDAIDVFDRKIQLLERAGMFAELQKKRRALDRLLPTIRAASDEIMRDLYITRASEVSGVAREVLERELHGRQTPPANASPPPAPQISPAARVRRGERRIQHAERGSSAERELVRAMLLNRARVEQMTEKLDVKTFRDPSTGRFTAPSWRPILTQQSRRSLRILMRKPLARSRTSLPKDRLRWTRSALSATASLRCGRAISIDGPPISIESFRWSRA
jgi:DNA primase